MKEDVTYNGLINQQVKIIFTLNFMHIDMKSDNIQVYVVMELNQANEIIYFFYF